jgi:AcrR family transcriptional regulator
MKTGARASVHREGGLRLALPARTRKRRTHAERTAETRAKVIAAVVDTIAENGFQGATAQAITRKAGVTWGAVQHHFGGKDALLLAVLEDSFRRFAERLDDVVVESTSVDERVSLFVDRAWEHFSSRHFRSTFEILLNYLGREEHADTGDWRPEMTRAWDRVWSHVFSDAGLPRRKSLMLQHFTVSTLSGLAATLMLAGPDIAIPRYELDMLKSALVRALNEK